jgi:hypothetical protein
LGSEKVKGLGCGLSYEQKREVEPGIMIGINFGINAQCKVGTDSFGLRNPWILFIIKHKIYINNL